MSVRLSLDRPALERLLAGGSQIIEEPSDEDE